MEYLGIIAGIVLFIVGFKLMDSGTVQSLEKEDEIETMPIVHYQNLKLRDYNKEPNNWTYFFGKVLAVLGGALILFMILFLTNVI